VPPSGRRIGVRTTACLVAAIGLVAACSGEDFPTLAEALERQPAGLVEPTVLDDGFVIDEHEGECDSIREAGLSRLDGGSGDERWEQPVPAGDAMVVAGDHVVSVGTDQENVPPSAVAVRTEDGHPVWQRFFAAQHAQLVGAAAGHVVVHLRGGASTVVALDPASGSVEWEAPVPEASYPLGVAGDVVVMLEEERAWFAVAADGTSGPQVGADAGVALAGLLVVQASGRGLVAHDAATAKQLWAIPEVFDATYTELGHITGVSTAALLIELDSRIGPDHRLLVIDPGSGQLRWKDDGVATSALAGDEVLLDVRTGDDPDVEIRRTAVSRSVADGAEGWRRPNTSVAGYLVHVGDRALLSSGRPTQPQAHVEFTIADLRTGEGLSRVFGYAPALDDSGSPTPVDATTVSPAFVVVQPPAAQGPSTVAAFDGQEVLWEERGERVVAALASVERDVLVLRSDLSYGCA